MTIHITNLSPNLIEADLQRLFTPFGEIDAVEIKRDKLNNRSQGSAHIDMPVEREALKAIDSLNGHSLGGKSLIVTGLNG
jgi:RNA recognition motif-containing protein